MYKLQHNKMSNYESDGLVERTPEAQGGQSKREQFENDIGVDMAETKNKSNENSMEKSSLKRLKKAAEESIINAIRKLNDDFKGEHSKITLVKLKN